MISVKNATKIFEMGGHQVLALDNVNLDVKEHDFLAVTGPSGSGKSTLLYTMAGLLTPTNGNVTVDDIDLYRLSPKERARFRRENLGFVFQSFELLPYLTALENTMLPLYLSNLPSDEQEEAAEEALVRVGLSKRVLHKPNELSSGEQQRVAIARSLVKWPRLLLADEPTGNLDQKTGSEIIRLLRDLNEKDGLTLVMVTHDQRIAQHATTNVEMIDGHIVSKANL